MNTKKEHGKIDWMITLVPLAIVIALCVLFFFAPEQSNTVLSQIRFFFGDTFGTYYLIIGLGIFIISLYIAGSKYGIAYADGTEKITQLNRSLDNNLSDSCFSETGVQILSDLVIFHQFIAIVLTAKPVRIPSSDDS